jgi:hypothetical protein
LCKSFLILIFVVQLEVVGYLIVVFRTYIMGLFCNIFDLFECSTVENSANGPSSSDTIWGIIVK